MARTLLPLLIFAVAACDEDRPRSSSRSYASASAVATSASASASASATGAAPSASAPKVVPDAIAAQHVLVQYKGAKMATATIKRSKADAMKRAEEVKTKAKAGSDFSALVAEYSDEPGAKERQGNLGKFTRDKMVKPFSDAAFQLDVNEISEVIETQFGYHVIKRNQ